MRTIIKGGRVIDPGHMDGICDILIENGRILDLVPAGSRDGAAAPGRVEPVEIIDAAGKIVTPGLIDMHVHLREPGHEHKETIESGLRAAVSGGFTAVCAMPNTSPVNDCPRVTEYIRQRARAAGLARVYPVASISMGLKGLTLSGYGGLKRAGAVAVSDDGRPVEDAGFMRRAMECARDSGLPVISHCEELSLAAGGAMNEGPTASRLGLAGIPNVSESIMVMRDIALSELTGAPVHIAHVSTAESIRAIREAKNRGVKVTAETAPHYFTLTEQAVEDYGTNAKMNPPLRSERDRQAVLEGLSDGTLDAIATDHAPHAASEKSVEFSRAPNGIIGLETALPLCLRLVEDRVLTLSGLIEKMSTGPAKILGLENGIRKNRPADITVIDPEVQYRIDAARFRSLSRNTPFDRWRVTGKAVLTMVAGRVVYRWE